MAACGGLSAKPAGGRTLIVNLPGSEKAARENFLAVRDATGHGIEMLLSSGSADCAAPPVKKVPPSTDQWLREAKASPDAGKIGMYLAHNGVVRAWLNEGDLQPGDDIMYVLVGGDIRPRVIEALHFTRRTLLFFNCVDYKNKPSKERLLL